MIKSADKTGFALVKIYKPGAGVSVINKGFTLKIKYDANYKERA